MPNTERPCGSAADQAPRARKRALYAQIACVGRALGQPTRLEILEILAQCPRTVETLSALLDVELKSVSAHLKVLLRSGLVSVRRHGRFRQYAVSSPEVIELAVMLQQTARAAAGAAREYRSSGLDKSVPGSGSGLDLETALRLAKSGELLLLDVRPPEEYAAGHLPHAVNLPLETLGQTMAGLPQDTPCAAYCRGSCCFLAQRAAEVFARQGRELLVIDAGVMDWMGTGRGALLQRETDGAAPQAAAVNPAGRNTFL